MERSDLSKEQAAKINKALYPGMNYLFRLRRRMEQVRFPPGDPLYLLVEKAYDAMHRLSVDTHYLSCGIGAPIAVGSGPIIEEADDMCGRYVCSKAPEVYGSFYDVIVPPIAPNFNVAPTHHVPVVRINDGKRECVLQRWGLIPSWAKDKKMNLINARADTLFVKPAFRASAKRRRCLILADGYYEWKSFSPKKKQPYYLRPKDDEPIAFAGIWECWKGEAVPIESCRIITTDANELSRPIHDQMPVILRGADAEAWIDPGIDDPKALASLLRPFSAGEMIACPVSPRVGKVGENNAGLIEPVQATDG